MQLIRVKHCRQCKWPIVEQIEKRFSQVQSRFQSKIFRVFWIISLRIKNLSSIEKKIKEVLNNF